MADILIRNGRIEAVDRSGSLFSDKLTLAFDDAMVLPGLINSHDHLDFNLFPRLGSRHYSNYIEWSTDIQNNRRDEIDRVLSIPKELRVQWGIYKNLLNGVTTVVNHGPYLNTANEMISVMQDCHSLHSVHLGIRPKYAINKPFAGKRPIVIHIGEGTDSLSRKEIDWVIKWNLFRREIIGVHGISMNERQSANFKALVWCPDSNYFLMGRTARVAQIKSGCHLLFGTDSTLSASWNMWEQMRLARNEHAVSDDHLLDMVTSAAADIWGLDKKGSIRPGYQADLLVVRNKGNMPGFGSLYASNPEDILLVVHKGDIRLFDGALAGQLVHDAEGLRAYSKYTINGCDKYIYGDLAGLIRSVRHYYPGAEIPVEVAA